MKAKLYFVLDILIFTGFLITFESQITGESIHEWLGAAFFLTLPGCNLLACPLELGGEGTVSK